MKELWIKNSVFIYIFFHKNGIFQKGQKKVFQMTNVFWNNFVRFTTINIIGNTYGLNEKRCLVQTA